MIDVISKLTDSGYTLDSLALVLNENEHNVFINRMLGKTKNVTNTTKMSNKLSCALGSSPTDWAIWLMS